MTTRRTVIALVSSFAAASLLSACEGGGGSAKAVSPDEDMFMGKADAPLTMIEYASVACSHCADWNNKVLPAFKAKYIDTGQVKLVTREINAVNAPFAVTGFLLARCAGKEKYHDVLADIYRDQAQIAASGDLNANLVRIAKDNGVSEQRFRACVTDPNAIAAQNTRSEKNAREDNVNSTPTFVINGEIVAEGEVDLATLDNIIAAAKAK